MLSFTVYRVQRRVTVQLKLLFLEIANPSREVWVQLEEAHREAVLGKLAQLIAKTALSESQRQENDND